MEQMVVMETNTIIMGNTCAVCTHERKDEIAKDLTRGIPQRHIANKYGLGESDRGSRLNIERHIERCLRTTWRQMKANIRITSTAQVDNEFTLLLDEAKEMYYAAKDVLIVDGELNLNPREHEISVVYRDWTDKTESGEPKLKSAKLSKLLAKISESGYEPEHSYIKAEDARKGLRDCLTQSESILDRFAKMRGAYQKDRGNDHDELTEIRKVITSVAVRLGTSYEHELVEFLRMNGHRLRPDLRGMLEKESQDTLGALGGGRGGGEEPLPTSRQLPEGIAENNTGKNNP